MSDNAYGIFLLFLTAALAATIIYLLWKFPAIKLNGRTTDNQYYLYGKIAIILLFFLGVPILNAWLVQKVCMMQFVFCGNALEGYVNSCTKKIPFVDGIAYFLLIAIWSYFVCNLTRSRIKDSIVVISSVFFLFSAVVYTNPFIIPPIFYCVGVLLMRGKWKEKSNKIQCIIINASVLLYLIVVFGIRLPFIGLFGLDLLLNS